MNNGFIQITDTESLDQFLQTFNGNGAILFKHSNTCGISSRAYNEMAKLECPVGLIVVQQSRPLSTEIERRWSLPHQTPQVLIVRDGELIWTASHFEIKAVTVSDTLRKITEE
jgi:bacillithiol system protein YtxJ